MGFMDKVLAAAAAKDVEASAKEILARTGSLGLTDEQKSGAAALARQVLAEGRARKIISERTQETIEEHIRAFLPATGRKG